MADTDTKMVHWSFWLIGGFALLWNVGGSVNFFVQMDAEMIASFRESEQAIINVRPLWATAGFGLAVFAGALGGLMLLLKKSTAVHLFTASLVGTAITMIHTVQVAMGPVNFSTGEIFAMIILPLLVAAFLLWFAKQMQNRGWVS